jgi:hypothetical protein
MKEKFTMALPALNANVRLKKVTVFAPNVDGTINMAVEAEAAVGFARIGINESLGNIDADVAGTEANWTILVNTINADADDL